MKTWFLDHTVGLCAFVQNQAKIHRLFFVIPAVLLVMIIVNPAAGQGAGANKINLPVLFAPPIPAHSPICGDVLTIKGKIVDDMTLPATYTYIVSRDLAIAPGVTLTILPGTVVKFAEGQGIDVSGKLVADGSAQHPVYFTSVKDDVLCGDSNGDGPATSPAVGDWSWIDFAGGSDPNSSIQRAVIRFAGGDKRGNVGAAIRVTNVIPAIHYVTFQENYRNAVQLMRGVWTSQTLDSSSVVYWWSGDLKFPAGHQLKINPGAKLKAAFDSGITIDGKIDAKGTSFEHIFITAETDDAVCGFGAINEEICDTNNDRRSSKPKKGDWKWIQLTGISHPNSIISFAEISYGGQDFRTTSSTWRAPILFFNVSPTLNKITFKKNYYNGAQLGSGSWSSLKLNSASVIYVLPDKIEIPAASSITLSPGVKIKSDTSGRINVKGKLVAAGTSEQPIAFTSVKDDTICGTGAFNEPVCDTNNDGSTAKPQVGDWQWIEFFDGSSPDSVISRAIVRYGGREIRSNGTIWQASVRIVSVVPQLEHISFANNYRNAVQLVRANWTTQTISSKSVVFWVIDGDVNVIATAVLTLEPGVKIKFGVDSGLNILGKLVADGTESMPIYLTSDKDDTVCGLGYQGDQICDTNNDLNNTTPTAGDWKWIGFQNSNDPSSSIGYAYLRYGGRDFTNTGSNWGGVVTVKDFAPRISRSFIANNYRGISISGSPSFTLVCNDIQDNVEFGIYNSKTTNNIVAENHWWGDGSGPVHPSNPGGLGQKVSDGVDFNPWVSTPCTNFVN